MRRPPQQEEAKLQQLRDAMRTCSNRLYPAELFAGQLGLTPDQFGRLFRKAFGMSFFQWRQQRIIRQAVARLKAGAKVKTIAHELGYSDSAAFSNAFFAATGEWPTQYAGKSEPGDSDMT
jgi:AraC-like DNA-binding protein